VGLARGAEYYVGVTIPEGEGAVLEENVPDKPNTPMNYELDWSVQRCAHDRADARL